MNSKIEARHGEEVLLFSNLREKRGASERKSASPILLSLPHGDERPRQLRYFILCNVELRHLFKLTEIVTANSTVAKVKSFLSPYFGAKDFAFAYAV